MADSGKRRSESSQTLAAVGQLTAVGAAMLPAVGVCVRWLSYSIAGITDSWRVALSASIPELAMGGAYSIFFPLSMWLLFFLLFRRDIARLHASEWRRILRRRRSELMRLTGHRREEAISEHLASWAEESSRLRKQLAPYRDRQRRWYRIPRRAQVAFVLLATIGMVIFAPSFPMVFLSMAGGVGVAIAFRLTARAGTAALSTTWPALAVLLATGVLIGGFFGATTGLAVTDVRFNEDAGLQDGEYFRLGEEGDLFLLGACRLHNDYLVVPKSAIRSMLVRASSNSNVGPSLFSAVVHNREVEPLGTELPCP